MQEFCTGEVQAHITGVISGLCSRAVQAAQAGRKIVGSGNGKILSEAKNLFSIMKYARH
jgi:hypothetical protein